MLKKKKYSKDDQIVALNLIKVLLIFSFGKKTKQKVTLDKGHEKNWLLEFCDHICLIKKQLKCYLKGWLASLY